MIKQPWAVLAFIVVLLLGASACAHRLTTVTAPGPYLVVGTPTPTETPQQQQTSTPAAAPAVTIWSPPPRTKTSGCLSQGGLPDPACSPGAIDPRVSQANIASTICHAAYSKTARPAESVTEKIKRDQMAAYGLRGQRVEDYELDHLVSLELGGAPSDVANLWPEPWTGEGNAHQKDAVENLLHEQVCRGAMQLGDAQRAIATDWLAVYTVRGLGPETSPRD